jgi:hypothetical protein
MKFFIQDENPGIKKPGFFLVRAVASDGAQAEAAFELQHGRIIELPGIVRGNLLSAELRVEGQRLPFEIEGVTDEDEAQITLTGAKRFRVEIAHQTMGEGPCIARCADESVGSPCVDCVLGAYRYTICC